MHNNDKLREIQDQKKRLRDRIEKLSSQNSAQEEPNTDYEENMMKLMEKKKKVQPHLLSLKSRRKNSSIS